MRRIRLFELVVGCMLLATLETSAVTIGFTSLAGSNRDSYTGHAEAGFTVTPDFGSFYEAHFFGDPIPSIFLGPVGSPTTGTVGVVNNVTGLFTFDSVDLSSNTSDTGTFTFAGWLGGINVLNGGGGFASGIASTFVTMSSPDSLQVLDLLEISLIPGADVTSMNLDNIVVHSYRETVPEAGHSAVLLGLGLLGILSFGYRFHGSTSVTSV